MCSFDQANLYVFLSAQAALLDGVIWCLGPYVDESKSYGVVRIGLARFTRAMLRRWCTSGTPGRQ